MMDSFFTSVCAQDTMSLQEMLDMDAGDDIDEIFSFDLHKLPTINLDDDSLGAPGENNVWLTSDRSPFLGGDVSNGLGSDLSVGETRMVSPNSVMPVTLIEVPYDKPSPSPKQAVSVKSAPSEKMFKAVTSNVRQPSPVPASDAFDLLSGQVFIKEEYMEDDEDYRAPTSFKNFAVRSKSRLDDSPRSISSGVKRNVQSIKTLNGKRRVSQSSTQPDLNLMPSIYPKPAYSYSCLIAMALKNSPSGSLPVSEIYNFMCEHFPYFKTAPNGWKNSVRHNLSLNKCFEKIEKPATNGSQRKGCLWAMNPNKVNKMDEEVQKWSKKDKSAIRKSMIYPESLDALERGQLVTTFKAEPESDDDQWDENLQVDDDDEEEEDDEEMEFVDNLIRVKEEKVEFDGDSDLSLTDVDLEMAESIYAEKMRAGKLNVQVKVSTSPNGFKPLLSGAYTVNSQGSVSSPKRLKTLGSSITGNYVYKPLSGAVSLRRKSPVRHSLLSSLEADD